MAAGKKVSVGKYRLLIPLTGEVKGKVLERTSRFVGVAAVNVGLREPVDKAVAAFFDNCMADCLQVHLEGDAGIAELVSTAGFLLNLFVAIELVADVVRSSPYETIGFLLSLTVEGQCKA